MEAAVIALSLRSLDECAKFSTSILDRVSLLPQCFSKLKGKFPLRTGVKCPFSLVDWARFMYRAFFSQAVIMLSILVT